TPSRPRAAIRSGSFTVQATSAAPRDLAARRTAGETSAWCSVSTPADAAASRSGTRSGIAARAAAALPAVTGLGHAKRETRYRSFGYEIERVTASSAAASRRKAAGEVDETNERSSSL